MPEGRMLSRSIALSEQLASVSLEAEAVFYRMIPHADREGRLPGSVPKLLALIAPMRSGLGPDLIRTKLVELKDAKLIHWYTAHTPDGDVEVIALPGFKRHQKGAHFDREAASKLPGPDEIRRTPDEVRQREVKGSEVEVEVEDEVEVKGEVSERPSLGSTPNGNRNGEDHRAPWQVEKDQARDDAAFIRTIGEKIGRAGGPSQPNGAVWPQLTPDEQRAWSRLGGASKIFARYSEAAS